MHFEGQNPDWKQLKPNFPRKLATITTHLTYTLTHIKLPLINSIIAFVNKYFFTITKHNKLLPMKREISIFTRSQKCMQWKDITSKINSNLFNQQIYINLFLPFSVLHNYWIEHNIKFCSSNLNLCILKIPIMHKVTLCRVVNSGINIRYFYHFLPISSVT